MVHKITTTNLLVNNGKQVSGTNSATTEGTGGEEDDLTLISDLTIDTVNRHLLCRYSRDVVYTYSGSILISVNPYKELPIYDEGTMKRYSVENGSSGTKLPPHIFSIAESAYQDLKRSYLDKPAAAGGGVWSRCNQSIVISGESGAGKTETTKFILNYLCHIITSNVNTWVEHQILEANTILEAFGNAKTVRNDNSSRFGKFMQVCFDRKWMIKGCVVQDYLLEQSRITQQTECERNYHVFYLLVQAAKDSEEFRGRYMISTSERYAYLNQRSSTETLTSEFKDLKLALEILQIPAEYTDSIFKTLSAILWLGNVEFAQTEESEAGKLSDEKSRRITENISTLLELDVFNLNHVLLTRQINVRGNITEIPLRVQEASENRHAMAKALYSRTFGWLIHWINKRINPAEADDPFLGLLDIFGFENFKENSFEQFCINYTNEKLHKFFNQEVFKIEQESYLVEGIKYSHIEFTDNTACLELIEKSPRCLLKLLSEQCHLPKGSDESYLLNITSEFHGVHNCFARPEDRRLWSKEFTIVHYAGPVTYKVDGFVDKNRDSVTDLFFHFLSDSKSEFIQQLCVYQQEELLIDSKLKTATNKCKPTVSESFRVQLQSLVELLVSTQPWYVRCIKPNMLKCGDDYDGDLVLEQLKYLGMLEIIRIRKEGYPVHQLFKDFVNKFKIIGKFRTYREDKKSVAKEILDWLGFPSTEWQLGKSKVFLRGKVHEALEAKRDVVINKSATIIQARFRGFFVRRDYRRRYYAACKIQSEYKSWKVRISYLRHRRAAIVIQSHLRGMFAREVADALREMRRVEEGVRKKIISRRQSLANLTSEEDSTEDSGDEFALKDNGGGGGGELASITDADLDNLLEFLLVGANTDALSLEEEEDGGSGASGGAGGGGGISPRGGRDKGRYLPGSGGSSSEAEESDDDEGGFVMRNSSSPPALPPPSSSPPVPPTVVMKTETVHQTVVATPIALREATIRNPPPPARLPEPTVRPPPVPNFPKDHTVLVKPTRVATPAVALPSKLADEPIYESIKPRPPPPQPPSMPPPSMPPLPSLPQPPPVVSQPGLVTVAMQRQTVTIAKPSQAQPQEHVVHRSIVTRKLQELGSNQQSTSTTPTATSSTVIPQLELLTYAENYFNDWPSPLKRNTGNTPSQTTLNLIPKSTMIATTKSGIIPSSHLHLYDPSNIPLAITIFKDLLKYVQGEFKAETVEIQFIQNLISYGIQREELRDEIYIQCVRLINLNDNLKEVDKLLLLLCYVSVCFPPGKILQKFIAAFFNKRFDRQDKAGFVLNNFAAYSAGSGTRVFPPSTVEIKALERLGTIVCRFYFLDGRTKAIDIHPMDTAGKAMRKLADKIGLATLDHSWAIYTTSGDEECQHVPLHSFLYDVIAQWELSSSSVDNNNQLQISNKSDTKTSKNSNQMTGGGRPGGGSNRFVFKKRLFNKQTSSREIPQDPVEVNLLYAQAVHAVVKLDAFPISEKVALQLGGLQLQVLLGDHKQTQENANYYCDHVKEYLPQRVLVQRQHQQVQWGQVLEQAHKQYGSGKSELVAKVWYLSCVMQYPLYGHTLFQVLYRGYWLYGNTLLLGISSDGISMIKSDDKFTMYEYSYSQIESISTTSSGENLLTINLNKSLPPDTHKCFVFETKSYKEIFQLISSYYPGLSKPSEISTTSIHNKISITNEDRYRLYFNLITCRKLLVESGVLNKKYSTHQGTLINTLKRRLSKDTKRNYNKFVIPFPYEQDFPNEFFAFNKYPLVQPLTDLLEDEPIVAVGVFTMLLQFAGVSGGGSSLTTEEEESSHLQAVLEKCWRKESLLNELYMQLIKQTTDHPEPNSRVNSRNWSVLGLICSLVPPANPHVRKYLFAHLKRCGLSDGVTLEGRFARFAEKCLVSTISGLGSGTLQQQRRQWSPSKQEILCTISCRPITSRFYLMDGKYHVLNFTPNDTASDLLAGIRIKIGLGQDVKGYSLYELGTNSWERSLLPTERPVEVMARWEKQRSTNQQLQFKFVMKKHLFVEAELEDPVEKELVYHQLLHQARNDRFPVSDTEAAMLVALQAQVELGDYRNSSSAAADFPDYCHVSAHCLPTRIAASVSHEAVARHHQSLVGTPGSQAKQTVLNLLRSWPLHRASIYDVTQSFTSNWPRGLWLAVDQQGVHLLQQRTRLTLCSFEYEMIISYSPSPTCFMLVTNGDGGGNKQSKIILNTNQGYQISQLIKEYIQFVYALQLNKH